MKFPDDTKLEGTVKAGKDKDVTLKELLNLMGCINQNSIIQNARSCSF